MVSLSSYRSRVNKLLRTVKQSDVTNVINILGYSAVYSQKVFIIGNGGSISTAAHFANDLRTIKSRTPFQALCLNDINSMSCIANDRGYDRVFYEPLMSLASPSDIVLMISASGNSPNLVKAFDAAIHYNLTSIAVTGFDGGAIKSLAGCGIHVESEKGCYREVEDAHSILCHYIVDALSEKFIV